MKEEEEEEESEHKTFQPDLSEALFMENELGACNFKSRRWLVF